MAERTRNRGLRTAALLACAALALGGGAVAGQSVTSGALEGVVTDATGEPMIDVTVTLTGPSGPATVVDTDARGQFRLDFLPVGEYELLAERLGFRPHLVTGIQVGQGRTTVVRAELSQASPPVDRVDTTRYIGSSSHPSPGIAVSRTPILQLPWSSRDLLDLADRSSLTTHELGAWGLPPTQVGVEVDGLIFRTARHSDHGFGRSRLMALPLEGTAYAEIMGSSADVERPSAPGGILSATTLRGGRDHTVTGYFEAAPGALFSPTEFDAPSSPQSSFAGAAAIAGPVAGDTAQYMILAGFRRDASAVAPLVDPDLAGSANARDAIVQRYGDAWGDAWSPLSRTSNVFETLGRIDWNISEGQAVFGRIGYARRDGDSDLYGRAGHPLVATTEGSDFTAAAGLASRIGESLAIELRAGIEASSRTYTTPEDGLDAPWTSLVEEGLILGWDPGSAGDFSRTTISLRQTTHALLGDHQLKFGVGAEISSHDITYAYNSLGSYAFPDLQGLLGGTGAFERKTTNDAPSFSINDFYLFAQDQWMPTAGLELSAGFRLSGTALPTDDIVENASWLELSGLSNATVEGPPIVVAPRFGFRWDPTGGGGVVIEGSAGRYQGEVDPGIVGSVIAEATGASISRAVGNVGSWPDPPAAVSTVPTLTMIQTNYQAPLMDRGSVALKFGLPGGASIGVAGSVGKASHLPRYTDLNRLPVRIGQDQNGRPLFGQLRQIGGLVVSEPSTSRLFRDFDLVNGVIADGEANYWGLSAFAEVGSLSGSRAFARYTYSRAEDDWLGAASPSPIDGIDPLPGGVEGVDWKDGRADFDVPHRLSAGASIEVPGFPVRLAGLYRFASGRPFTPGFRRGVDMNGDGIAGNDPAYIPSGADLGSLRAAWPCLGDQVGGYVDRNACRDPNVHMLDLRLAVRVGRFGGSLFEVMVDALDILNADVAVRDRALYLVDPTGTVSRDAATNTTTVPLVLNPDFGRPLLPLSNGRSIRVALQVRN